MRCVSLQVLHCPGGLSALPRSAQRSCSQDTATQPWGASITAPAQHLSLPLPSHRSPAFANPPSTAHPTKSCPAPARLCATSPAWHSLQHRSPPGCTAPQLPFHRTAQLSPADSAASTRFPACYGLHLLTAQLSCEHSSAGTSLQRTLPSAVPSFLLAPQPSNAPYAEGMRQTLI